MNGSGMNLSKAEGYLLLGAAALVAYAMYKAYQTGKGLLTGASDAAQTAYKTATNFVHNGKCGMCAWVPFACDFVNPTWMTGDCAYVPRDVKTLDRTQQTATYPFDPSGGSSASSDPPTYDPNLDPGTGGGFGMNDRGTGSVADSVGFDQWGNPLGTPGTFDPGLSAGG